MHKSIRGISFTIFPTSWAFGPWNLPRKWLFAIGPFRFVYHKSVRGEYKESTPDRNHY